VFNPEWLEGGRYDVNADDRALVHDAGGRILFAVSRSSAGLPDLVHEFTAFQRRHMSARCSAESLSRFPCAINTTFRKMIPMRWCCIDHLSWHDFTGTMDDYIRNDRSQEV
jgi:hypothetical protein